MQEDFHTRESDQSVYIPFFYSSTRQQLHQRLLHLRDIWTKNSFAYIAPAGPQGVGKSLYCYMICSFAAVHGFPLLYIPLAGKWCTEQPVDRDRFLLTRFTQMNSHLNMEDSILEDFKELAAIKPHLCTDRQDEQIRRLASQLLRKFGSGFEGMDKKIPRFIVIDEHNELFLPNPDGSIAAAEPQLQPFARWGLGGVAVMCGSSHSKFFSQMPGGTSQAIVELPPLSKEDTVAFLTHAESPAFISGLKIAQAEALYANLGGVPRILTAVKQKIETLRASYVQQQPRSRSQSKILEQVLEEISIIDKQNDLMPHMEMDTRLIIFMSNLGRQKKSFINAVEHFFLKGRLPRPTWNEPVLDHGLIFIENGQAHPVNQYAARLLFRQYAEVRQQKLISSIALPADQGSELERQIWQGLSGKSLLVYEALGKRPDQAHWKQQDDKKEEQPKEIFIEDSIFVTFEGLDFSQLEPLPRQENGKLAEGTWIFRPRESKFTRVDFVIVKHNENTRKIIAIQSTVSEPNVHAAASSKSDWEGFFGISDAAAAPGLEDASQSRERQSKSSHVTWTALCQQLAIQPEDDFSCDYIYVTTIQEPKPIADSLYAQLPASAFVGVIKRKHLTGLKIIY